MTKKVLALATAATLGIGALAVPAPAQARGWFGPSIIGGLAAGALFGALTSPAYAWGGPYGCYGGYSPYYWGGYAPAYYGGYGYGAVTYPGYYRQYSAVTVGYAPYYRYRYRRVFRPAYAYYGGPWIHRRWHGHWHHRWHHHW
jgi:hypothetical protein